MGATWILAHFTVMFRIFWLQIIYMVISGALVSDVTTGRQQFYSEGFTLDQML